MYNNSVLLVVNKDRTIIKKTKSINSANITLENYKDMYFKQATIKGIRKHSEKNYLKGYVKIFDKFVVISPFSYTKRTKLYNKEGL